MIIKNLNNITKDIKNKGLRMLLLASNLEYAIKKYNCPDIYLGNIINTVGDNGAHLEIEFIEKNKVAVKKNGKFSILIDYSQHVYISGECLYFTKKDLNYIQKAIISEYVAESKKDNQLLELDRRNKEFLFNYVHTLRETIFMESYVSKVIRIDPSSPLTELGVKSVQLIAHNPTTNSYSLNLLINAEQYIESMELVKNSLSTQRFKYVSVVDIDGFHKRFYSLDKEKDIRILNLLISYHMELFNELKNNPICAALLYNYEYKYKI